MADIEDAPEANDEIAAEDADLETASGDEEANIGQEENVSGTAEHLNAQLEDESSNPHGDLADDAGVEEALQAWEEGGHVLEENEDSEQISAVRFAQLEQAVPKVNKKPDLLKNVAVQISVELGRKDMSVSKLSDLKEQDVIELEKLAGEPFDIRVNGRLFATGEVVVVTDLMAVRITSLYQNPDTQRTERE
jgi:flagellar motor switch protein FliN/FliY